MIFKNNYGKVILIFSILILLLSLSAVSAESRSSCDFKDLQKEVDNVADGTCVVLKDNYTSHGPTCVEIHKDLTINGKGNTIDGNNQKDSRMINIKDANVNLENIVFKNIKSGFIKCSGNSHLSILNCTFINGFTSDSGGAISNNGNFPLRISNSTFLNNHADDYGGAVYSNKDIILSGCTFIGNSAGKNSFNPFSSSSTERGGAVCSKNAVYSSDSTFKDNIAYGNGGAIFSGYAYLSNTTFINNKADAMKTVSAYGGAVRCKECLLDPGNIFKDNFSKDSGGAIYTDYVRSDIVGCTFIGNHANNDGGSIYVNKKCDFNIMSCNLNNNYANAGDGGAIYSDSKSTIITLTNSTFKGNYANGGIAKRYGGAIYSKGPLNLENIVFSNNWAENRGGAIYCDNTITFNSGKTSYFIGNVAKKSYGGAVYASKLNENVKNIIFSNNRADGDGGAVYINNACNVNFSNCVFSSNVATKRGGAIYTDSKSASLSLTNNIFHANSASDQGQSVFNCGKYTSIAGNWWGLNGNNGNNDGGQLYEYHTFKSNEKHVDSKPASLGISVPQSTFVDMPVTIKISHPLNLDNSNYHLDKIVLSSSKNGKFVNKTVEGSNIIIKYIPYENGKHSITISEYGQKFIAGINVADTSVVGFDLVKNYGDSTPFVVKFKDANGNLLGNGTAVKFIVNGFECNGTVLENGVSKLNIDLKPGNYTVKSVNTVTGESSLNKISVVQRTTQYYVNDVYALHLHNSDGSSLSDGTLVEFVVGNRTFTGIVKDGVASFKLDLAPGKYDVEIISSGNVIYKDSIKVSKRTITPADSFTSYGNLKPIANEVFVHIGDGKFRSDLGNNYYRVIDFATNTNIIMYNITVEDAPALVKAFKGISENTVKADLFNINLRKKMYIVNDVTWKDSDYSYLVNVHYGNLIINGNGASIVNKAYPYNSFFNNRDIFAMVSKNANLQLNNVTISNFAQVYKNFGKILSNSTVFSDNVAQTRVGEHKIYNAAVIDNFNTAFFVNCVFKGNKPTTHMISRDDAGVLYANKDSRTYFVNCDFKTDTDTICAFEGSNVNFYTSNPTLPKGYYEGESCVSFKPLSTWYNTKANVGVFNCTNTGELVNALKYINGYNNYTSVVINLKKGNYSLNKEYLESVAAKDYHNQQGGLADRHYFCFEAGVTPVTINGNGSTISTKGIDSGDDYHFGFCSRYGSLSINNVTFKHFNSAIRSFGMGKFNDITFDSNIYTHTIRASFGGALYNAGIMNCLNCTFKGNIARFGGAIYSTGPLLQIVGGSFENNKATPYLLKRNEDIRVVGSSVVKLVGVNPVIEKKDDALVLKRCTADTVIGEFNIASVTDLMNVRDIVNSKEGAFDIIKMNFNPKVYNSIFHRDETLFDVNYGNVIINGNGASIGVKNPELGNEVHFLKVGKIASVELNNFNVSGFNTAIINDGALNINHCLFNGNKVEYKVKDDYAGAIHNNGYCNIYASKFLNNYAKYGGALYNKGYCNIYNSTFSGNMDYKTKKNVDVYNYDGICNVVSADGSNINVKNEVHMSMMARDALHAGAHVAVALVSFGTGYAVNSLLLNAAINAGSFASTATIATYNGIATIAGTVVGTGVGSVFTLVESSREHNFDGVGMAILQHAFNAFGHAKMGADLAFMNLKKHITSEMKQQQFEKDFDNLIEKNKELKLESGNKKSTVEDLNNQITTLKKQKVQLQNKIDDINKSISKQEKQISHINEKYGKITTTDIESRKDQLSLDKRHNIENLQELCNERAMIEKKISEIQKSIKDAILTQDKQGYQMITENFKTTNEDISANHIKGNFYDSEGIRIRTVNGINPTDNEMKMISKFMKSDFMSDKLMKNFQSSFMDIDYITVNKIQNIDNNLCISIKVKFINGISKGSLIGNYNLPLNNPGNIFVKNEVIFQSLKDVSVKFAGGV